MTASFEIQSEARARLAELLAVRDDVASTAPAINAAINAAIAEIVIEESSALLDDFDATNRELAVKADRLNQAREAIQRLFETGGRPHDVAIAQERFIGKFERAKARPPVDYDAASHNLVSLRAFESALRSGKTDARLGDADNATFELPQPVFTTPQIEDPASAAVVLDLRRAWGAN